MRKKGCLGFVRMAEALSSGQFYTRNRNNNAKRNDLRRIHRSGMDSGLLVVLDPNGRRRNPRYPAEAGRPARIPVRMCSGRRKIKSCCG